MAHLVGKSMNRISLSYSWIYDLNNVIWIHFLSISGSVLHRAVSILQLHMVQQCSCIIS